jgi:dolichol-phosphate mannosyltransferase
MSTGQGDQRPSQRTLVIIPTFNERENLPLIVGRVHKARPDVHILIVDDGSPDGTGELADELALADTDRVHVMHRASKGGLGAAYLAGFAWGLNREYAVLVEMDADGSHPPEQLHRLLDAVDGGADLAIGSRYVPGGEIPHWPWFRRALSRYGNLYASAALGTGIRDATSGYRVYRADTLKAIDYAGTRAMGYGFQIETAYRVYQWDGRIAEVPIIFTDRVRGYSKMSWHIFAEELLLVTWWGLRDRTRRLWRRLRSG